MVQEYGGDFTIQSQSVCTALHVFTALKLPSVALYLVEFTFQRGFDSFRAPHPTHSLSISCVGVHFASRKAVFAMCAELYPLSREIAESTASSEG
jgi:hypothetical protein